MIPQEYKNFQRFDPDSTYEGKLLMAAIAVLTSIDKKDICEGKYGGSNHPDVVMKNLWELANYIFHQQEFGEWKILEKRDQNISKILD